MRGIKKIFQLGVVRLTVIAGVCLCAMLWLNSATAEQQRKEVISRNAFTQAYKVFMHPRCMNCHPAGNVPLQFDNSVPHAMLVQGGPKGKGVPGMKCNTCHQKTNWPGKHMPPGAPNWHLPPPEMPMVFQNKTPAQLARQLKDFNKNGGKTLQQILHHVSSDPLVKWGWNPGEGRSTPPLSHAQFANYMKMWIENGAFEPK